MTALIALRVAGPLTIAGLAALCDRPACDVADELHGLERKGLARFAGIACRARTWDISVLGRLTFEAEMERGGAGEGAGRSGDAMTTTSVLGDRLRRLREADGLSRGDVAERCGINAGTVWRIEAGRHEPRLSVFAALARLYCLTLDELYEDAAPRRSARRRPA